MKLGEMNAMQQLFKLDILLLLAVVILLAVEVYATPAGEYEVVALRRSSTVESTPETDQGVINLLGKKAFFGKHLSWIDGTKCENWFSRKAEDIQISFDDPNLSDVMIERVHPPRMPSYFMAQKLELMCGAEKPETLARIVVVDDHVLITPSPSGSLYIVLQKPYTESAIRALQLHLKLVGFYQGRQTGKLDLATRGAIARFADYRGADYVFKDVVVAENLLDDLYEEIKIIHAGPVTAHFYGYGRFIQKEATDVRKLSFTFDGDNELYIFKPLGEISSVDWQFDIFSPDAFFVHLLQDQKGPYHIVQTKHLKSYLKGEREPDYVVGWLPEMGRPKGRHSDAKWISNTAFRYTVSCCGERFVNTFNLSRP
jgi:hypothetical protein